MQKAVTKKIDKKIHRHSPKADICLYNMLCRLWAVGLCTALFITASLVPPHSGTQAHAQGLKNAIIIRDTEIESVLKRWSTPLIEAADLQPDNVNFILIQNPGINAFVAGGPNIFLFTGLIEKAEQPEELMGVIAHELGHIRGGHLVAMRDSMQNASYESIIGAVLGIGAAIVTGEGGLGSAIAMGSQSLAANRYLAFSRTQESAADQAALSYMEDAGINPTGLLTFMQKLESQELLPASQQSEYVRTHPLTRDRIMSLEDGVGGSAYRMQPADPEKLAELHRIKAKLLGFIYPAQVAWSYHERDQSVPARYARAIAHYRQSRVEEALAMMADLRSQEPENPYFQELTGQMLVDFGRVREALPFYEKAAALRPDAPLVLMAYAHTLLESRAQDAQSREKAIEILNKVTRLEPRMGRPYRLLATAHGQAGRAAHAQLYLAEEALLRGDSDRAVSLAERALAQLPPNSREALQAQDVLMYAAHKQAR